jgi:AcrR family transcriptional regulator
MSGLTPQEVAAHQRGRLIQAMIDTVGSHGYANTSVTQLRVRAGVSPNVIYREFHNKEAYFLATYDVIVKRAIERVNAAFLAEQDWRQQLHSGFDALAREVVDQPKAARLALVEVLGAGQSALAAMERSSEEFEALIQTSFRRTPDGVTLPTFVARGIVGGISRVARQLLLDGRESELPALAHTLVEWSLAYRSRAARALPPTPPFSPDKRDLKRPTITTRDEHARILRGALRAASGGYSTHLASEIIREAQVSEDAFFERYTTSEECFLAAYDRVGAFLLAAAAESARHADDWQHAIQQGISTLLYRLSRDPDFTDCAFVQVFAVGPAGIEQRSRLMDGFTSLLLENIPPDERPPKAVAEAIVGAIWQLAHGYARRKATHQLAQLTEHATYLTLAPIIGADKAVDQIVAARQLT